MSAGTGHAAQGTWRHHEPETATEAPPPAPAQRSHLPGTCSLDPRPAAGSPRKPCGSLVYTCAAGGHGSSSPPLPSPLPLASELGEEAGKPSFGR